MTGRPSILPFPRGWPGRRNPGRLVQGLALASLLLGLSVQAEEIPLVLAQALALAQTAVVQPTNLAPHAGVAAQPAASLADPPPVAPASVPVPAPSAAVAAPPPTSTSTAAMSTPEPVAPKSRTAVAVPARSQANAPAVVPAGMLPVASLAKPAAAAAAEPATNEVQRVPPEIDPALRGSREALATTNLLPEKISDEQRIKLEQFQDRLAQARAQRREREYDQAEKNLAGLLGVGAPEDIERSALLELALTAQDQKKQSRAQQIYSQYVQRFHEDPSVPEVLLRQGLLYREMGAPVLALSKFYAVMSSALSLKLDRLAYYQRLVLQAQTEIADTYFLDGRYEEAADFFGRLLKLEHQELNREEVLYKLVRSWANANRHTEALAQAQLFARQFPNSSHTPEIRFIEADSLKRLGRKNEARDRVLALMRDQQTAAAQDPELWSYWQQRTGNELANQFYQEGDFLQALDIYLKLAELNAEPNWRLPSFYQAGLAYERLRQPAKAAEIYTRLLEEAKDLGGAPITTNLNTVIEMARWRRDRLGWQSQAEIANQEIGRAVAATRPAKP